MSPAGDVKRCHTNREHTTSQPFNRGANLLSTIHNKYVRLLLEGLMTVPRRGTYSINRYYLASTVVIGKAAPPHPTYTSVYWATPSSRALICSAKKFE